MQKLRDLYAQTQNNARNNFDRVTLESCRKIQALVTKECDTVSAQNDYTHLDELSFYQEKFRLLIERFEAAINDKSKKPKLQADVIAILSDNSKNHAEIPPPPTPTGGVRKEERVERPREKDSRQVAEKPIKYEEKPIKPEQKPLKRQVDPKQTINSYFDMKKSQIQRSKIGFKSVLENIPRASQKYAIRSNIQVKKDNDQNIGKMTKQIEDLTKKLDQTKKDSQLNLGIVQAQKKDYETKINQLVHQIEQINRENERLRHSSQHLINSSRPVQPTPIVTQIYVQKDTRQIPKEVNDPRSINYRSNDMFMLNKKYNTTSDSQPSNYVKAVHHYSSEIKALDKPHHKSSEEEILLRAFPQHFNSQPEFERSNLKFNKSEVENEQKNIIIRSKLSFFKPEIVLYRCQQFELGLKSYSLAGLQIRKVAIHINNRDRLSRRINIVYNCDPSYYEITILKKLNEIQGLKQGKQEIQVKLKNRADLDSLVQAKLTIDTKTIRFIIPTMMIQFQPGKHQPPRNAVYDKQVVGPIISQFSTIFGTMDFIPLEKDMEQRVDAGAVYARSKYHEGFVYLKWKSRQEVEIQTIKPWSLFFGYLFLKDY